jgi:hypothetical protein
VNGTRESEYEWESGRGGEPEWEAGRDGEFEDEAFIGGFLSKLLGGLTGGGDGESEWEARDGEYEYEAGRDGEFEGEARDGEFEDEAFIGGFLSKLLGGLTGGGDGESEWEARDGEYEWEARDGESESEQFFPALIPIAQMALPLLGKLFGGGRRKRRRPAREFEAEGVYGEYEDEQGVGELGLGEGETAIGEVPAMAEVMAAMASETNSAAEADALVGAATIMVLTPRERRALERLIPTLVRATTVLSRLMRRRRITRRGVRVIPTVVKATAAPLATAAARGYPPTTSLAGRVLRQQTRTVLTRPAVTRAVMRRNANAVRRVAGGRASGMGRSQRRPYLVG